MQLEQKLWRLAFISRSRFGVALSDRQESLLIYPSIIFPGIRSLQFSDFQALFGGKNRL